MKTRVSSNYLVFLFKASIFFIFCNTFLPASIKDYWQQYVHYTMNITLIPESHEMKGTSHIVYVNNSPENLDRIYMHLYPNAFQKGSVKYREFQQKYGRLGRIGPMLKDIAPYEAGITIHGFKITMGGNNFSESIKIEDTFCYS